MNALDTSHAEIICDHLIPLVRQFGVHQSGQVGKVRILEIRETVCILVEGQDTERSTDYWGDPGIDHPSPPFERAPIEFNPIDETIFRVFHCGRTVMAVAWDAAGTLDIEKFASGSWGQTILGITITESTGGYTIHGIDRGSAPGFDDDTRVLRGTPVYPPPPFRSDYEAA